MNGGAHLYANAIYYHDISKSLSPGRRGVLQLYVMARVAKALIENKDGDVLFLVRSDTHPHFAGHIDLPGGIIESDEDFVDGLVREIFEETGVHISPDLLQLKHEFTDKLWHGPRRLYHVKLDTSPEIDISWEHSQYHWSPLATLLDDEHDNATDHYMREVKKYIESKY